MSTSPEPTFLGIGGQRCRSSWIHKILYHHPEVYVTPLKELQYFTWRAGKQNLDWYLAQFAGSETFPIRGEITPTYSTVSRPVVQRVGRLFPDLRLFMTIRNPVERAWSYFLLKNRVHRRGMLPRWPVVQFYLWLERERLRHPSNYVRALDNWEGVYGRGSVRVWTFEEMAERPVAVLRELFHYLGATSDWTPPQELVYSKVLSTPDEPMPPLCRWYLSRQYLPMVRSLRERLGERIEPWVRDLEECAADVSLSREFAWHLNRSLVSMPEHCAYRIRQSIRECRIVKALDNDLRMKNS